MSFNNIKATSLRLGNLSEAEVMELWQQHTTETGQTFDNALFPELWQDTSGQPWLVNALGYELTWNNRQLRDRSIPITLQHYWQARENLIQSRVTHLDQLTDKLKEPRVHRVIAPLLSGANKAITDLPSDDLQYVEDLGLIQRFPMLSIANRIYRETIPRELVYSTQYMLAYQQSWYLTEDNRIDMPKLLNAFQQFFRENADAWIWKCYQAANTKIGNKSDSERQTFILKLSLLHLILMYGWYDSNTPNKISEVRRSLNETIKHLEDNKEELLKDTSSMDFTSFSTGIYKYLQDNSGTARRNSLTPLKRSRSLTDAYFLTSDTVKELLPKGNKADNSAIIKCIDGLQKTAENCTKKAKKLLTNMPHGEMKGLTKAIDAVKDSDDWDKMEETLNSKVEKVINSHYETPEKDSSKSGNKDGDTDVGDNTKAIEKTLDSLMTSIIKPIVDWIRGWAEATRDYFKDGNIVWALGLYHDVITLATPIFQIVRASKQHRAMADIKELGRKQNDEALIQIGNFGTGKIYWRWVISLVMGIVDMLSQLARMIPKYLPSSLASLGGSAASTVGYLVDSLRLLLNGVLSIRSGAKYVLAKYEGTVGVCRMMYAIALTRRYRDCECNELKEHVDTLVSAHNFTVQNYIKDIGVIKDIGSYAWSLLETLIDKISRLFNGQEASGKQFITSKNIPFDVEGDKWGCVEVVFQSFSSRR